MKPGGRVAVVLPDGTLFGEGVKTRLKEHLMEECNLHTIVRLPNSGFKPYASTGTNVLSYEKGACIAAVETRHPPPDQHFAALAEHPTFIEQIEADIARQDPLIG